MQRRLVESTGEEIAVFNDCPKRKTKFQGLTAFLIGQNTYANFQRAAHFHPMPDLDLRKCTGYECLEKQRWVRDGGILDMDHAVSRAPIFDKIKRNKLPPLDDFIKPLLTAYYERSMQQDYFQDFALSLLTEKGNQFFWYAQLLSHPANCAIVDVPYNCRKSSEDSLELPELIERIVAWEAGVHVGQIPRIVFSEQSEKESGRPQFSQKGLTIAV